MRDRTAIDVARTIRAGRSTALAECEAAIARIEERDGAINAVVVRDFDRARAAAKALDETGPDDRTLFGVPMTVKEAFDIAGLPTTWGLEKARGFIADKDATVVRRLKAAGAVILGKTNVPVALSDWQSVNPVYGRTNHPDFPDRTPGGSSGGSAAALASGMVPLEIGSDIGGSIRVPAHFCGLWGHKTSYGMVDSTGHLYPGTDGDEGPMGVIGPMARNADDLAAALDIITDIALPHSDAAPAGLRVGAILGHPSAGVDNTVRAATETALAALDRQGADIVDLAPLLPDLEQQHADYMRLLGITMTRGAPSSEGKVASLKDWFGLRDAQARCARKWRALFGHVDAVLAPPGGVAAFPHIGDVPMPERTLTINGEPTPFGAQFAWAGIATFPNLPATSVPVGTTPDGLPVGVQVICDLYQDHRAIAVARCIGESE